MRVRHPSKGQTNERSHSEEYRIAFYVAFVAGEDLRSCGRWSRWIRDCKVRALQPVPAPRNALGEHSLINRLFIRRVCGLAERAASGSARAEGGMEGRGLTPVAMKGCGGGGRECAPSLPPPPPPHLTALLPYPSPPPVDLERPGSACGAGVRGGSLAS